MVQLRFQYKKFWESGVFQETHIGFSTCHCHIPDGLKLITRLGLSHLRFHEFKHSFQDTLNPSCSIMALSKQPFSTFLIVPIFKMKD